MPAKAKRSTTASVKAAPSKSTKGKPVTKKVVKTVETPVAEDQDESDDDDDFEGLDTEDEEADIVILTPSDDEADEDDEEEDEEESGDEEYDSDESDDVSEAGMARLMKALGEDGLDEDDIAALAALRGEEGEEEDDGEEEEEDSEEEDDEDDEEEEDEDEEEPTAEKISSGSKDTLAASLLRSGLVPQQEEDEDEDDDEEENPEADESAIAVDSLTDAAFEALPDAVRSTRFHKEKTNNKEALTAVRDAIALDPPGAKGKAKMDWIEHMAITWDKSVQEELAEQEANAEDDLKRELTIYKQALHAATLGRQRVLTAGLPFSRPDDFFAEMVKSDSHMERIRQKLLDERSSIKASEDAKRQRELKKFGKKVQVEKQLERQKNKKDLEEKIQGLKRKRGNLDTSAGGDADDEFDVKIESAISENNSNKRNRSADNKARMPRSARDSKYGFGGKKRHSKSNTKESTEAGFGQYKGPPKKGGPGGGKGKKGGAAKRPGKSKRAGGRR